MSLISEQVPRIRQWSKRDAIYWRRYSTLTLYFLNVEKSRFQINMIKILPQTDINYSQRWGRPRQRVWASPAG